MGFYANVPTIEDVGDVFRPAVFRVGREYKSLVTIGMRQGVDSFGKRFKPYSSEYRRARVSAGRTGKVDLTLRGELARKILAGKVVVDPSGTRGIIRYSGTHRGAAPRVGRVIETGDVLPVATLIRYIEREGRKFIEIRDAKRRALLEAAAAREVEKQVNLWNARARAGAGQGSFPF